MCHTALLIKVVIINFVHAFLKSADSTTATSLLKTSPLFLCKNKELFHVVIYLLLSRVQAQCFDQPWRVNVLPVAVLQECKQILQMLTDGLGLIIWKKTKQKKCVFVWQWNTFIICNGKNLQRKQRMCLQFILLSVTIEHKQIGKSAFCQVILNNRKGIWQKFKLAYFHVHCDS